MLLSCAQLGAFAADWEALPETEIDADILENDVFYFGAANAVIAEEDGTHHLLRVGRGGAADGESSVLVKIADVTAKLGEDYTVSVYRSSEKVDNPEDNASLLERMEGAEYAQRQRMTRDELVEALENDPEAFEGLTQTYDSAVNYVMNASGLAETLGAQAESASDGDGASLTGEPAEDNAEAVTEEPDAEAETGADADTDAEAETVADTDADAEAEAEDNAEAVMEEPANDDAETVTDADADESAETVADAGTDEGAEAVTEEPDAEAEAVTNADANEDAETVTDADAEENADAVTGEPADEDADAESAVDPVQKARAMFTGISEAPQRVTAAQPDADETADADAATDSGAEPVDAQEGQVSLLDGGEKLPVTVSTDGDISLDPVQQARQLYTGIDEAPQRVTATDSRDLAAELQSISNVMTNAVVGASVRLTFAPGEKEKFLVITAKDNRKGDGDRYAYLILSETSGSTVNSALSSCALTITDDEGQDPSEVFFSAAAYEPDGDKVTVEVRREGALNSIAAVKLSTEDGTAKGGRDYSEVRRELVFPFGVDSQTVEIPVRTSYFTGDADFTLKLQAVAGAVVTRNSATVTLTGTWDKDAPEETASLLGDNTLSTVKLGTAVNVLAPYSTGNTDYFGGANKADGKEWYMHWEDNSFWKSKKGTVGATWDVSGDSIYGYHIQGARVNWRRSGSDARMKIGFASTGNWSNANYDSNLSYNSKNKFGNVTWDAYSKVQDTTYIGLYNQGDCDNCNDLHITSITPILRPFEVTLAAAESLSYLNADGSRSAKPDYTRAALDGAPNNQNDKLIVFPDDTITVKRTNSSKYAYLSGLQLVSNYSSNYFSAVAEKSNDASDSIAWKFAVDKITHYGKSNYFTFATNNSLSSSWDKNQHPLYGQATLRPVFGYINSKVTLKGAAEGSVTLNISGKSYTATPGATTDIKAADGSAFHKGDILSVTASVSGNAAGNYSVTGLGVRYKSDGIWYEKILPFEGGKAVNVGDANDPITYEEIVLEPKLTRKDAPLVVRVPSDQLAHFDRTKGFFTKPYTTVTEGYETYYQYVCADASQVVPGKIYPLTAVPARDIVCVWQEYNNDRYYEGNTFQFKAQSTPIGNVVYLTAEPARPTAYLKGKLLYSSYNLKTGAIGTATQFPASGAVVTAGGMGGVADSDGNFTTSSMPIARYSFQDYYLRYLVSVNGFEQLGDIRIPDGGGAIDLSQTFANGVAPQAAPIFKTVELSSSNEAASGTTIPITSDDAILTATFSPVNYDVVLDSSTGDAGEESGTIDLQTATLKETPTAVKFVVYSPKRQLVAAYDGSLSIKGGKYAFSAQFKFTEGEGTKLSPGDMVYLRLTTDRAAGSASGDYLYSDIFTGYTFTTDTNAGEPVLQGVTSPLAIKFASLPLLGEAGVDFDFPFVSVSWEKTDLGYRMKIGVSATQVVDEIKGSEGDGDFGDQWKKDFQDKKSIGNFASSMKKAYQGVFKTKELVSQLSQANVGAPSWDFDVQLGITFDFWYYNVYTNTYEPEQVGGGKIIFAGVGGFVAASASFGMAWYVMIPVVFIPAYISLKFDAQAMGVYSANRDINSAHIAYDEAQKASVKFDSALSDWTTTVEVTASATLALGVGLCGVLGVRAYGTLQALGFFEPKDGKYTAGGKFGGTVGLTVDLLFWSTGLNYGFDAYSFGNVKEYEKAGDVPILSSGSSPVLTVSDLYLRKGNEGKSRWVANSSAQLLSGFTEASSRVLVENGYERPDSQLLTLSDGTVFLAFLDNDPSKGEYQRTTLKVAAYRNGAWSEPVAVQDDNTADFQPSICEAADGQVMLAWVSAAPDNVGITDPADYHRSMEVYTAMVDSASLAVSEVTRLTNDEFYDFLPSVAYDSESGDRMVYYAKSGSTAENVHDLANPYTNDCAIVYMPYDSSQGRWLFDYYFEDEIPDENDRQTLLDNWHGQRFLSSPIPELGLDVPNIADFTVTTYNGLAVYAYTIDKDGSNDTDADKEIFAQIYDFREHRTYRPIRITNDAVTDALPQMFRVRNAQDNDAHTKLFWYRDNKQVCYIDITQLVREGINDDGTVKPATEERGDYITPSGVTSVNSDTHASGQGADFRVLEDSDGSLYVLWTQPAEGADGDYANAEIFATSLINYADDSEHGTAWSRPYRLTASGRYNDEVAAAVDGDGNLILVHNQFDQSLGDNEEEAVKVSNLQLMSTAMEPCGAMDVERVTYSDTFPQGGETITATVEFVNNGLTLANGYTAKVYSEDGAGKRTLLQTIDSNDPIIPANGDTREIEWTIPESADGARLYIETTEAGMRNVSEFRSEPLAKTAYYQISNLEGYQAADGFHLIYTLTNAGNADAAATDTVSVKLSGPLLNADSFEASRRTLYSAAPGALAVGESKDYDVLLDMAPEMFSRYGFAEVSLNIRGNDGDRLTDESAYADLTPTQPMNLTLNEGKDIALTVGETQPLSASMDLADLFAGADVVYTLEDPAVAAIAETESGFSVRGVSNGQTALYATHSASGAVTSVNVTVTGETEEKPEETELPEDSHVVTFDFDNGTPTEQRYVTDGQTVTEPPEPTRPGYKFDKWYLNGAPFDFSAAITEDVLIQAQWIAESAPAKAGCYVATAVYGSYDCPEVWTLRRFRDHTLAKSWYGRLFIRLYYALSPTAVRLFGGAEWFQDFWRGRLDKMVSDLQAQGFESTPYEDMDW